MIAVQERPQRSKLSLFYREHKELLDWAAPCASTRTRCCAAKLMNYFQRWESWKITKYPTRWVYQPLAIIRDDLLGEHSIHVIRAAIKLLEQLGFLERRKNLRADNWRNGQDRTWQYRLCSNRILVELKQLFGGKAETPEKSPFVNCESPTFESELPTFTVERYTQIPYTDSCKDSCSLKETKENLEFLPELEDPEVSQSTSSLEEVPSELQEDCDNNKNMGTEQFSAALTWKCLELLQKCVELLQDDVKPQQKLKSDSEAQQRNAARSSGFRSDAERDGFYQALLELGKSKGKNSPVGWASAIIKSIDAGDPCQYLNEYRSGLLVGSCEQQEWEVAPGQPYEQFVTYLKTKNQKTGMTDEEALALVHRQLKDTNVASSLWESCKRCIVRYQDDWEKQKRLGVSAPYVPPELLPSREVTLEQAAIALQSLQSSSAQVQEVASAEIELTLKAASMPEDVQQASLGATGVESSSPETKPTLTDLQTHLNSPLQASVVRAMVKANQEWGYRVDADLKLVLPVEGQPPLSYLQWLLDNKLTAGRARQLIDCNPEWGFLIGEDGQLWEF